MYTVKQLMSMTRPLINQHGASYAVWPNNFIHLVNMAVSMIYDYEGMHRSRQHRKDLFNMNKEHQWALFSRWPVRKIDKFRWGNWKDVDKVGIDNCFCNMNLPDKVIPACCNCNCTHECQPIDLQEILPQNQLCGMQYQISWSAIAWMWGMDWRIIKVDLWNLEVDDLRVTYFCWPVKLEKFDDIVPLPDTYMQVAVWIIAALVLPMYGVARQQEDLTYYSLYRKELDYLRKHDTIVMEKIHLPENHLPDINWFLPANNWKWLFTSIENVNPW